MTSVVVIGAGIGGLAAAARLARAGYQVTVLEKNSGPGGRTFFLAKDGFQFDTGPTLFLMPAVFAETYAALGERMEDQLDLPFPTMSFDSVKYKVTGVVTNREIAGDELIWWYRKRCGKSEEAHSVMKEDLAGGKLPSGLFGANAAWWHVMILALNLNSAMKRLVLGKSWVSKRLKAIRFSLINLPGRVLDHARSLIVRLTGGHPSNGILFEMRRRILKLCESG